MKRQLKGIALEDYKANLPKLNQKQKNIIVGALLGDATLQKSNSLQPLYNLKFEQKSNNKLYIDHIYSHFKDWCGCSPQYYIKQSGEIKSYWFKTYGHRSFDFYAHQFYTFDLLTKNKKRIKVVPRLIHRWLNAESLAYWFMDDGNKSKNKGYYLNTQTFSLKENERLADALGKAFGFEINIHIDYKRLSNKKYYRLYITSKSVKEFTELIRPYIHPCFEYKLINHK